MNSLLIGLLGALLSTNQAAAAAQVIESRTAIPISASSSNTPKDAVEAEFQKLMEKDEAILEEAERMIQQSYEFGAKGAAEDAERLADRVELRFSEMRRAYEDFLRRNPKHVEGWLAYGSFLNETGREPEAVKQWEKAKELDPSNPASWNNLANYYGHRGPVKKAFEYYEKAISLNTNEPVYYQNLATTTYLFRVDAKEYYKIDEQQVFDRAITLYRKARALDPNNFLRAADYAQTYYGIKPLRTEDALAAWNYALGIASTEEDRQGVRVHLARVCQLAGRFEEAKKHLEKVTLPEHQVTKERVQRTIARKTSGESGEEKSDSEIAEKPPKTNP